VPAKQERQDRRKPEKREVMKEEKQETKKSKPRRRQRGTGRIFQKTMKSEDGKRIACKTWVIQFSKDGRRVREYTGMTEWAEADKLLRQRLVEVDKNEYVVRRGKPARFEDLYQMLVEHTSINHCSKGAVALKSRIDGLKWRWKHLEPVFGHLRAANLTTDDLRRYTLQRQEESAENASINRELATLRRMLNLGSQSTPPKIAKGAIPHIPMLKECNVRTGFVEDADFTRLVTHASELWLRAFLEVGFTYGWRKGELLGLRVRNIDLIGRKIRLDVGSTKNGEGREVAMTAKVADLLQMAAAKKQPNDYVFTREDGKRVKDFRGTWYSLCTAAGLGKRTCLACHTTVIGRKCDCGSRKSKYEGFIVHDLRRSAAKVLRAAGVPQSVVKKMGGWKTDSMFERYAIVSESDQRAAVEMLERRRLEKGPLSAPFTEKSLTESMEKQNKSEAKLQ
jgi:integrase